MESLSIVVASAAGGEFLFRCLDSLRSQVPDDSTEVIVVDRCGDAQVARIEREYPFARVVRTNYGRRTSVPELRMLGAQQAHGDILAVLEEHCVAPPRWVRAIRENFRPTDAAIGGPILDAGY